MLQRGALARATERALAKAAENMERVAAQGSISQ
jgi:hypothetical protein